MPDDPVWVSIWAMGIGGWLLVFGALIKMVIAERRVKKERDGTDSDPADLPGGDWWALADWVEGTEHPQGEAPDAP